MNGFGPIMSHTPAFTILIADALKVNDPQKEILLQSTLSVIVTRLVKQSKNGEMLDRLKNRLGLTKEEIDKLIFEL